MGHVGSCDSTIKLPRPLNSTTIRCGPTRCAQSASGLDTSTLKLSTCKVQNDHATSTARHTATCPQARTPIDTMREDSMLVPSTRCPIAEFGQVSAWLDTSGMRAMHGEMTQSQRVESDRHKGSPSRLVWCVIARPSTEWPETKRTAAECPASLELVVQGELLSTSRRCRAS